MKRIKPRLATAEIILCVIRLVVRATTGVTAGQCQRGLPARRDRSHQLPRLEAQVPARGPGRLEGLAPTAKSYPMTAAPEMVARIEELAPTHPAYGCNRIEALLAMEGRRVSRARCRRS